MGGIEVAMMRSRQTDDLLTRMEHKALQSQNLLRRIDGGDQDLMKTTCELTHSTTTEASSGLNSTVLVRLEQEHDVATVDIEDRQSKLRVQQTAQRILKETLMAVNQEHQIEMETIRAELVEQTKGRLASDRKLREKEGESQRSHQRIEELQHSLEAATSSTSAMTELYETQQAELSELQMKQNVGVTERKQRRFYKLYGLQRDGLECKADSETCTDNSITSAVPIAEIAAYVRSVNSAFCRDDWRRFKQSMCNLFSLCYPACTDCFAHAEMHEMNAHEAYRLSHCEKQDFVHRTVIDMQDIFAPYPRDLKRGFKVMFPDSTERRIFEECIQNEDRRSVDEETTMSSFVEMHSPTLLLKRMT